MFLKISSSLTLFLSLLAGNFLPLSLHADSSGEWIADLSAKEQKQQAHKLKIEEETKLLPWLTGPLLTSSGHVIPNGHYNVEPYLFFATNFGIYNQHWKTSSLPHNVYTALSQTPIQIGLPGSFDLTLVPQFSWNHVHGAASWTLNDMPFGFDYQLLNETIGEWWPAIKLAVRGNFPFGKYQKLDPNKKRMDVGGSGSWIPSIGIVMSRLFWFGGRQFLAARWQAQYAFPTPVHVKNYNTYGGGHHTRGKVFPGQALVLLMGMEYTWTRHWALACDFQYLHLNKTRFTGRPGKTNGVANVVGGPSSEQFSIAPAIEYNWSNNIGLIAGVWFSVGGRNTAEFADAVIALNIYK